MTHKETIEELAYEIKALLSKHNMDGDTCIYFNDKRLQCLTTNRPRGWRLEEGYDPTDYTEYCNSDTITMTFEGIRSMYNVVNGYENKVTFMEEFEELLDMYGYYYELGNAWNLTLYET